MDYIVFGTGYGATLLLLGWALRTFGPILRYREAEDDAPASGDHLVQRLGWVRFTAALGAILVSAGSALILITFLTALINPGDDVGAIVIWICVGAIVIGIAVWLWLYVARFGSDGLVPEQLDITRLLAYREPALEGPFDHADRPAPVPGEPFGVAPARMTEGEAPTGETGDPAVFEDDEEEMEPEAYPEDLLVPDDAYEDLFAMYGAEEAPVKAAAGEDAPFEAEPEPGFQPGIEVEEELAPGDVPAQGDLPDETEPEPELAAEDEETSEGPDESVEDEPAEAEVVSGVADEEDHGDGDEPEEGAASFEVDVPLPDTPEGRAEALRRIQEWEPDDEDV